MTLVIDLQLLGFEVVNELVLLDKLEKLRKTIISLVMFVCLSVRPHGTNRLLLDGFSLKNDICVFFEICQDISSFLKLLNTKRNLLYIRNQSVPRCKHSPPRL